MTKPLLSEWSFDCAYLKNKPGLSCTVRPSGNVLMVRHVFAHALSDPLKIWSWAYRPMTKPLLYEWTWRRSLNCPVLKNKLGLSCTQNFLKSSKKWEKSVKNTKFLENWLQTRLQMRLQTHPPELILVYFYPATVKKMLQNPSYPCLPHTLAFRYVPLLVGMI